MCDRDTDIKRFGDPRTPDDGKWMLLPAPNGTCSQCAVDHPPEAPHNRDSLYYGYAFFAEHGRCPTWVDALAHCDDEIYETARQTLADHGVDIPTRP